MRERIIFLDIDGPMIPFTQFLFHKNASFDQILDERCIKVLRKILNESDAKIVFNTTHNTLLEPDPMWSTPGLRARFREAGFVSENFHAEDHTDYPHGSRLECINRWLAQNGSIETLWVALDDAVIDHKRAYHTNGDLGIGLGEYQHAVKYLLFRSVNLLL